MSTIPIPIPDPSRPWGGECTDCKSVCAGHFLSPSECIEHIMKNGTKDCMMKPPTQIIKESFNKASKSGTALTPSEVTQLAKKTLLPECDISFWIQHLEDIKKRRAEGARKAQATRAKSK